MFQAKASFAVVAAALMAMAPAASYAACVDSTCIPSVSGSVSSEGADDRRNCFYMKDHGPRPHDWSGADDGAPYLFWRTKQWGETYPYPVHWTVHCCDVWPAPPVVQPDDGGPDTGFCAIPAP